MAGPDFRCIKFDPSERYKEITMLKYSIKFARIRIIATCFALAFLGSAYAGSITYKTLFSLILIIGFTIHANSVNDYSDREIDKVNLKNAADRPLVTQDINTKQLWVINILSALLILVVSLFYGGDVLILGVAIILIDYAYSLKPVRMTNRTIISPILLSISYVYYSFSIGFLSVFSHRSFPWLLTVGLTIGFFARLLLKDFRDKKGDKKFGKITFLLRYGQQATCVTSGIFWLLALSIITVANSFSIGLALPLLLAFLQAVVLLRKLLRTDKLDMQQRLISYIAKGANYTIITLLTYFLCKNAISIDSWQTQVISASVGLVLIIFNWLEYRLHSND